MRKEFLIVTLLLILISSQFGRNFYFKNSEIGDNQLSSNESRIEIFEQLIANLTLNNLNGSEKNLQIDNFIEEQTDFGFPIIENDTIYFVYRGNVKNVSLVTDFTGIPSYLNNNLLNSMCVTFDLYICKDESPLFQSVPDTNLFYLKFNIENDTRFEYHFGIQTSTNVWTIILDNLNNQTGIFDSTVNEVIMPNYQDVSQDYLFNISLNSSLVNFTLQSSIFGDREKEITVYLPPEYDSQSNQKYDTIYFADGPYYLDGVHAKNVLDSLIYMNVIDPVIGVFIPPFDRLAEYVLKYLKKSVIRKDICIQNYAQFLKDELVPYIDDQYPTKKSAASRAHIGLSASGQVTAYVALSISDIFNLFGIHSGAFWLDPWIISSFNSKNDTDELRFYMNAGRYEPAILIFSNAFAKILENKDITTEYKIYPTSHTFALWRATLGETLQFLFSNATSDYTGSPVTINTLDDKFKSVSLPNVIPAPVYTESSETQTVSNASGFTFLIIFFGVISLYLKRKRR